MKTYDAAQKILHHMKENSSILTTHNSPLNATETNTIIQTHEQNPLLYWPNTESITYVATQKLHIHRATYANAISALMNSRCIERVRKGSGKKQSIFFIYPEYELTHNKFEASKRKTAQQAQSKTITNVISRLNELEQRIKQLEYNEQYPFRPDGPLSHLSDK